MIDYLYSLSKNTRRLIVVISVAAIGVTGTAVQSVTEPNNDVIAGFDWKSIER